MKGIMVVVMQLIPLIANAVITELSPAVKEVIVNTVKSLDKKADETKNPFDDILIDFIKSLFAAGTFK